jgi:uncharacterized RDD family membrane protein YckC
MTHHAKTAPTKTAYGRFSRRLRAFVIDWIIIALLLVIALFAAMSANSDSVGRVLGFTFLAVWLLYEPILVCLTGSTVGHYVCNLRVVDDRSHGNISFLKAAVRLVIKSIVGIYSFITTATTSRHQALHDLLTRSTVQIRDPSKAVFSEYVVENTELLSPTMPSRMRRTVVIFCYSFASFISSGIVLFPLISESCRSSQQCSSIDIATRKIVALILIGAMAVFVIQGWRGRLYGCRVGDGAMQDRRGGTKVWGLAATLGFAILAFVIWGVIISSPPSPPQPSLKSSIAPAAPDPLQPDKKVQAAHQVLQRRRRARVGHRAGMPPVGIRPDCSLRASTPRAAGWSSPPTSRISTRTWSPAGLSPPPSMWARCWRVSTGSSRWRRPARISCLATTPR